MENTLNDFARRIDHVLSQDRELAVLSGGSFSTKELKSRVSALAENLTPAANPGSVVAILSNDDACVFAALTTCLRLQLTLMVLDPEAPEGEAIALLKSHVATVLLTDRATIPAFSGTDGLTVIDIDQKYDAAGPLPPIGRGQIAILVHTSGTTDKPKIVELSYANLAAQFAIFSDIYGFDQDTRAVNLLPFHHVDGLIRGPLLALWFDATLLRNRRFSVNQAPDILSDMSSLAATHLITVPAMLRILHRSFERGSATWPNLRFVLCSADYLNEKLWHAVERDFKVPVVNAYGLSEVVCDALIAGPDDATRIKGTIGVARGLDALVLGPDNHPLPNGTVGELAIRGGTVMQGYRNDPDSTKDVLIDGIFRTGDLVRRRADGAIEYVGRKKNVVVVGGVTIYPEGVTEVLGGLSGVAEAYTFGHLTDTGEVLIAAVCPLPGVTLAQNDIFAECRARLAPERQPSKIAILSELPRRASGKVDRKAIVAILSSNNDSKSVLDIAAECFRVDNDALSRDSTPFNTAGWDSLAHMEFVESLEEVFDFTMSPADIAGLMSLGDAMDLVDREAS